MIGDKRDKDRFGSAAKRHKTLAFFDQLLIIFFGDGKRAIVELDFTDIDCIVSLHIFEFFPIIGNKSQI
jgi:hypothetical protein